MTVRWSNTALNHLDAIYAYIANDSPEYATRTVDRLTRRSEQIAAMPQSGRRVPEFEMADLREVIEGSYRIIDLIAADHIDVLAVVHGARDLHRLDG
jgi:plasmid stabilization system protein ParE